MSMPTFSSLPTRTAPEGSGEAHGVKHCLLLKVTTNQGLVGWSDVETAPHVAAAVVRAPASGAGVIDGLRSLVVGEDPFEVERLWDKVYRGTIYFGRRGVAMQVLSGFDIACHDIMGKATGRPLHKLLGGARRDRVRAYASTLFRPTPDAMRRACEFYLERGFTAVKFGWGPFGRDRDQDVALVAAARQRSGRRSRCSSTRAGWWIGARGTRLSSVARSSPSTSSGSRTFSIRNAMTATPR